MNINMDEYKHGRMQMGANINGGECDSPLRNDAKNCRGESHSPNRAFAQLN